MANSDTFQTTVTSIIQGLTNTGRFPYAYASLACGHSAKVELRPSHGTCGGCGTRLTSGAYGTFARCACGTWMVTDLDSPRCDVEADRVTKVGDVVDCDACQREVEHAPKVRAALLDARCTHTRFRQWGGGDGMVTVYHADPTSPTGVLAAISADARLFDRIYDELRREGKISSSRSPLSPTEGLGGR